VPTFAHILVETLECSVPVTLTISFRKTNAPTAMRDVMGVCMQYLVAIGSAIIALNERKDRQTDRHCSNYKR